MNALQLLQQVQAASETEDTTSVWRRLAEALHRKGRPIRIGTFSGELRAIPRAYKQPDVDEFVFEGQDLEYAYHIRVGADSGWLRASGNAQLSFAINAVLLSDSSVSVFSYFPGKIPWTDAETPTGLVQKLAATIPEKLQDMRRRAQLYAEKRQRDQAHAAKKKRIPHART